MDPNISTIRHQLDLSLHMVDTTTGKPVTERNIRFFTSGREMHPVARGNATYVFLNNGRENFGLEIRVYGYETVSIPIRYEELDAMLPAKEVFLLPAENAVKGEKLLSFSGKLSGLETIDAVRTGVSWCGARKYDEKKRQLKLLMSGKPKMEETWYGLVNQEKKTYEAFEVEKILSPTLIKLKSPLQESFRDNAPVSRIIFGQVYPDGKYLLRVRDDAEELQYLVRYRVAGMQKFQSLDFHKAGKAVLR